MKRLFTITILLLLVSLKSSSQTDTVVRIPRSQAVLIVQDLLRYDQLKNISVLMEQEIELYDKILGIKNQQIDLRDSTISRLNTVVNNQSVLILNLNKERKKQKVFKWIAIAVGTLTTSYFVLK